MARIKIKLHNLCNLAVPPDLRLQNAVHYPTTNRREPHVVASVYGRGRGPGGAGGDLRAGAGGGPVAVGEELGEEHGEGGPEHGQASADYADVFFDYGPEGGGKLVLISSDL